MVTEVGREATVVRIACCEVPLGLRIMVLTAVLTTPLDTSRWDPVPLVAIHRLPRPLKPRPVGVRLCPCRRQMRAMVGLRLLATHPSHLCDLAPREARRFHWTCTMNRRTRLRDETALS